jgi:hypothetical protein
MSESWMEGSCTDARGYGSKLRGKDGPQYGDDGTFEGGVWSWSRGREIGLALMCTVGSGNNGAEQ